jgi:PadR family transcriptional regulator AphA
MSLEHVILGWLNTGRGSGYDLVRQLDYGLGWFWTASHSQIYPLLRKMEDEGLITSESTLVGEKLEKRVYTITEAGALKVRRWAAEPVRYPPNRDVERLKLIFGDHGDVDAIRAHLREHHAHYARRKQTLQEFYDDLVARKHPRIESRIAAADSEAQGELILHLREAAYRGDIRRAEAEMAWAEDELRWVDEFEVRR